MINKLTQYLANENECLKDILAHTKEIKRLLDKEEMASVTRLLSGREKKIAEAERFQGAVIKIFDRSKGAPFLDDERVTALKGSMVGFLNEINSLDDEIGKVLREKYSKTKESYKKTKEINLLKKSYKNHKGMSIPKIFDTKL